MPSKRSSGKAKEVRLIPALSIFEGRPVVFSRKKGYDGLEDDDGEPIPAKDFVQELVERFGDVVYLMDIDGIERNRPQYSLIKELSKEAELWVDAGTRAPDSLIDIFVAGAEKAVISTKTMEGLDDMVSALEVSEKVMLSIDIDKRGIVARNRDLASMYMRTIADIAMTEGIGEIVLADYSRKRNEDLDRTSIHDLVNSGAEVYVGGKVVKDDAPILGELGARGGLLDMRSIVKDW
jgi:uncharacterized protein related to proFAR isomerase